MPGPQRQRPSNDLALEALRELVEAILVTDYRDRNGVSLRNSIAFLNAQTVIDLDEILGTGRRDAHY